MSNHDFKHREFIGREDEINAFIELVHGDVEARILTVRGKGGMGKSHLLQMLAHHCRTHRPAARVCLVSLQEIGDGGPQALLQQISDSLKYQFDFSPLRAIEQSRQHSFGAEYTPSKALFDNSDESYNPSPNAGPALLAHIRKSLVYSFSISELQDLALELGVQLDAIEGGSDITSKARELVEYMRRRGRLAQLITAAEHARPNVAWDLDPTMEDGRKNIDFQQLYIDTFFQILCRQADTEPVVLLLDTYEQCNPQLQHWLIEFVCARYFFHTDQRPGRLVLVFAGRDVPDFETILPVDEVEQLVRRIDPLGLWRAEDIERCLSQYAPNHVPQYANSLHTLHSGGVPVLDIVQLARTLGASQRGLT